MSAARKKPTSPDLGGLKDDWQRLAALRQQEQQTTQPSASSPPPPPTSPKPEMTRRSWYVERGAAEAFQRAVDDIHYATRVPKHIVAGRLFRLAAAQADRITEELSHESHS